MDIILKINKFEVGCHFLYFLIKLIVHLVKLKTAKTAEAISQKQ